MSNEIAMDPVYKYSRGKWKEMGGISSLGNPVTRREINNDTLIKNLHQKSIIELEELISRQEKILKNKVFLSRLKDSGKNIKQRYEELKNALEIAKQKAERGKDQNHDSLVKDANYLEWDANCERLNGEIGEMSLAPQHSEIEEDEDNPLLLLARHSVEYPLKDEQSFSYVPEDPAQVIQRELEKLQIDDSKSGAKEERGQEPNYFGRKLLQTVSHCEKANAGKKSRFKTHRPLRLQSGPQAASPSKRSHSQTEEAEWRPLKLIPLEESLSLIEQTHRNDRGGFRSFFSSTDPSNPPLLAPSDRLHYRDTNAQHHLLDDKAEIDEWFNDASHHHQQEEEEEEEEEEEDDQ